ncbi:anti-sigma factor antagonist [candidate division KSB1 bacterium]|nr:anti-sigma factor antagonist [candidate division KSB1 bacterium]
MEGIQLSVEKTGVGDNISVIKVGGYIDTTTSSELEHALDTLLKEDSYNIIIDLGNVDYVSSAGWGIFISEIKGIREKGGDLKLVRMIPEVYEVFELLEFHYILKAFDTLEEAVKDFERNMSTQQTSGQSRKERELSGAVAQESDASASPEKSQSQSIEGAIKEIIAENPDISTSQLARTLNTPQYGNIKLGWFGLRKTLKTLQLKSPKDRKQFATNYKK